MARKNLFERLANRWDLAAETDTLCRLIQVKFAFEEQETLKDYTIRTYAGKYCFRNWKNRGHFLDLDSFLEAVSYKEILADAKRDPEAFLDLIEIFFNLYFMAHNRFEKSSAWKSYEAYTLFPQIANDCLAHFNHRVFYDPELEQAIVTEDKPEVTAVVEIETDRDLAFDIIRYNHHALKGDIAAKKAILIKLGSQLEPFRTQISACNKALEKNIFFMLNNLNIRHNNCVAGDINYKAYTSGMDSSTLEAWYDELYQLMLLAKLELDNVGRTARIDTLKKQF